MWLINSISKNAKELIIFLIGALASVVISSLLEKIITWSPALLILSTIIIALLGVYFFSASNQRIQELTNKVDKDIFHPISKLLQKEHWPNEELMANATRIDISGVSLTGTLGKYKHILPERLKAGAHIRIIIADPCNNSLLEQLAIKSVPPYPGSTKDWQNRLETSAKNIEGLAKIKDCKGKLEIGYLQFFPSYGSIITNGQNSHGSIRVELYHHRTREANPTFDVQANDGEWYDFFKSQYELLWESCRTQDLTYSPSELKE